MYKVVPAKQFIRSLRKLEHSGLFKGKALTNFNKAVNLLAQGKSLPISYRDHQLVGEWQDLRECHVKGDLLLVYQHRDDALILLLIDIGSHSQIFG